MKQIFLSTVVLLALASGSARAEDKDFEFVPIGSWPYSALAQLAKRGEIEGMKPPFFAQPMSRYEFAVVMARWMDHQQQKGSLNDIDKSSKDIGCALGYEFAPEIVRIEGRGPAWDEPLRSAFNVTSASEWFEIWWNNPFGEKRIPNVPRVLLPAFFLRRQAYPPTGYNPFTTNRNGHK